MQNRPHLIFSIIYSHRDWWNIVESGVKHHKSQTIIDTDTRFDIFISDYNPMFQCLMKGIVPNFFPIYMLQLYISSLKVMWICI